MMDKMTLNNEIVSLRPVIRQVKVHTINKLIRESKKLKSKNGTDQQKEKNLKKSERLTKEALLIKKLKEDDVSKFAISNGISPAEILADVSVPLEKKAMARLSTHKVLAVRVNNFRAQYPVWDKVVPTLLSQLGAKYKSQKSDKRQGLKKCKKKTTALVPQNEAVMKDDILVKQNDASKSSENIKYEKERKPDQICKSEEEDNGSDNSLMSPLVNRITNKKNKVDKPVESQNRNGKCNVISVTDSTDRKSENTVAEIRRFADLFNESESVDCDLKSGSDSESNLSNVKSADPFFLLEGSDSECLNSAYSEAVNSRENNKDFRYELGTCREKSKSVHQLQGDSPREFKKFQLSTQLKDSRDSFIGKRVGVIKKNLSQKGNWNFKSFQHKPNVGTRRLNRKERRLREFQQKDSNKRNIYGSSTTLKDTDESIHPSWEAKRKLKEQQMMTFQGKKIKFDDD